MSKIIGIMVLTFSICFIQVNHVLAEKSSKSIQQLSVELLNNKDENQRKILIREFKTKKLQTPSDVDDIIQLAEKSKDKELKHTAINKIEAVKEADKHLAPAYIKALDNKDKKIRVAAIIGIGHMKAKEASPKLREIVKDFGKVDYMEYKALERVDYKKAVEFISEAGGAAMVLGDLKDEEAVPILVDKFDELKEYSAIGLSKIGRKALPALLDLAKKETDKNNAFAHRALTDINDKEAKADLIYILKTETDPDIRMRVLDALVYHMYDDEVLQVAEELFEKEKNSLFMSAMKTEKAIPFLIGILKNDKNVFNRARAASILGDIKDLSSVPALEEALKDWNSYVKDDAADALEKITGKKYEWRKK